MLRDVLRAGFSSIARHPGLVVLLYAVNGLLAFVLSIPIYNTLADLVGPTGFGPDLAGGFDVVLWSDIIEAAGPAFGAVAAQLLWVVPLYLVWKTAAHVGLIHALRGSQVRSFWQGVGRYTGRALLLTLLYSLVLPVVVFVLPVAMMFLGAFWQGEAANFWITAVILPTLFITFLSVLDLMQDYSRTALVTESQSVASAWWTGIKWPFQHGAASRLYVMWFVLAATALALPTLLDLSFTAGTNVTIWLLFVLQQIALLARAAVTVGWIGSEVAFFEDVRLRQMPLIAQEDAPDVGAAPLV